MSRVTWPLQRGYPVVRVFLTLKGGAQPLPLILLADTGAGSATAGFELVLEESDCLLCGGQASTTVRLTGAYAGQLPVYRIRVQIPEVGFDALVPVAGVPTATPGFNGIAAFRFLNRF